MILDSSALIAVLLKEAEERRITAAILAAPSCFISAPTLLETAIMFERRIGDQGAAELDRLVASLAIGITPFTPAQAAIARQAFRRFGKGRHSAQLNFGDCFAYALAKDRGEPLLFKGSDFSQTDIAAAPY